MDGKMVSDILHGLKPAILMVLIQFILGGVNIFYKLAVNDGMSVWILVAYRFIFASCFILSVALIFERNRPKLTGMVVFLSCLSGLFGGPVGQGTYIKCLALTSPTFAAALSNLIPAITLILAFALRIEKLGLKTWAGNAKLIGTFLGIAGAMTLTFYKGPSVNFFSTNINLIQPNGTYQSPALHPVSTNQVLGSVFGIGSCFSYGIWFIIQAKLTERYPYQYSTAAISCIFASISGSVFAMCMERDWSEWKLGWNIRLASTAYTGVMASRLMFPVMSWCIMVRGPVFVSVFNPLMLIFVVILGALLLCEKLYLGSVIGSVLIIIGLYGMIWGKGQELKNNIAKLAPSKSSGPCEMIDIVVTSPKAASRQDADTTSATQEVRKSGV